MLIYVDQITERLIYTLDFIFKDRKIHYQLTNDWREFKQSELPKFVYSDRDEEHFFRISPAEILFDEDLFEYSVQKDLFHEHEFLKINKVTDPFASVFYVLSRYEEYHLKHPDIHDRFTAAQSILYQFGWHQSCICDRWAEFLIHFLEKQLQIELAPKKIPSSIRPTFDIDNTFAFKWKSRWRNLASKFRDRIRKDHERLLAREAFEQGNEKDPYDSFEYIRGIKHRGFDVLLFWLSSSHSKYDRNISILDSRHQQLIQTLGEDLQIGLHPSYKSNEHFELLEKEKSGLESCLGNPISCSRQHFLKLKLPETYLRLLKVGFTDDYTMGFSDQAGFRAGTARSFLWFDLHKNRPSQLRVHPFAYMDGTLNEYMRMDPVQAKELIQKLYLEVKKYGGEFICIWHNETITDFGSWKGWNEVLEFTLKLEENEI
ncbi:MAG: hypothetical protein EP338_10270 [Bacteroidetes bacterium]|nr:MAG: hypothetical protein EP338_10270 [Bacteroidota bacterium]